MGIKITSASLQALNTSVRATFLSAYKNQGPKLWYRDLVVEVPSDSRSNTYPIVLDPGAIREWTGERVVNALELGSFSLDNVRYEKTVGISRDDVADDNTGALRLAIGRLAERFAMHPQQLLAAVILSNPTGPDGVSIFNDSHPRNPVAADGNTYDNLFASTALTASNYATVRSLMATYIGPDGQVLGVMPDTLIVPPALERTAREIVQAGVIPMTAGGGTTVAGSNVLVGTARVLVVPELSSAAGGSDTTWYMADLSSSFDRPFIFQTRDPLEVVAKFAASDDAVFERNELLWGATIRYAIGAGSPYRIAKCTA